MTKQAVLDQLRAVLQADLDTLTRAAQGAFAAATDPDSKAENKYDTRGLEASYLARGQSKQAAELEQALHQFQALTLRDFGPETPVDIGALVELGVGKEHSWYFIGPRAGGTEVTHAGNEITVITPQSPIGQLLVGRKQGEKLKLTFGGKGEGKVVSVS